MPASLTVSVVLVMCFIQDSAEIQNVRLVLPPIVQAGTSATLLCLYDLEGASLYSVQWYRGQFEFFRYVPGESPPTKVFPIPGLDVDISTSNDRQVTLRNIPVRISGEFSCEVTTEAPPFSASCISENLTVVDFNLQLSVPNSRYGFGELLVANCSVTPRLGFLKLKFQWNKRPVSEKFVVESSTGTAFLKLNTRDLGRKNEVARRGELGCSAVTKDSYYVQTKTVSIELEPKLALGSTAAQRKLHFVSVILPIVNFLIIK